MDDQPCTDQPADSPDPDAGSLRRNYLLGVGNGALAKVGMGFLSHYLVLAAFLYDQTQSNRLVGLLGTLAAAGLMWPQLHISSLIEHRPRKKPFYVASTIVRIVVLLGMSACIGLTGANHGTWALGLFFVAFFLYWSAQGAGVIPFYDIVGRTIPANRLGGFFGQRSFFGDLLAVVCGLLVIQPILRSVPSPTSYAVLTLMGTFILTIGWVLFSLTREQENHRPPKPRNLGQTLAGSGQMLRHSANYRNLLWMRILGRFNILLLTFYVPYGVERLGATGIAGVFLSFISASRITSSLILGRIGDRKGNRICLVWAGLCFALSPVAALLAPRLPVLFNWPIPYTDVALDLRLACYLVSLGLFGLALQANQIGVSAFLIEAAPPNRRPSYIAFLNTVTFPFTFLPLLAGLVVGQSVFRLELLFAAVTVSGVLSFVAASRLTEVRQPGGHDHGEFRSTCDRRP